MPMLIVSHANECMELCYGDSLTKVEEINDMAIPFGCKAGACGSCAIVVHSGAENLNTATTDEVEFLESIDLDIKNCRLACQCRLYGDVNISLVE